MIRYKIDYNLDKRKFLGCHFKRSTSKNRSTICGGGVGNPQLVIDCGFLPLNWFPRKYLIWIGVEMTACLVLVNWWG